MRRSPLTKSLWGHSFRLVLDARVVIGKVIFKDFEISWDDKREVLRWLEEVIDKVLWRGQRFYDPKLRKQKVAAMASHVLSSLADGSTVR